MTDLGRRLSEVRALLNGHARLFAHEFQFEKEIAWRRLRLVGVGVALFLIGVCFLEVAVFGFLKSQGLSSSVAALILAFLNGGAGALVIWLTDHRDPLDGKPFERSRQEMQRSLRWIGTSFIKEEKAFAEK